MTATDERQTLADFAETAGWHRRNVERTDYYAKGGARVQVRGASAEATLGSRWLAEQRRPRHRRGRVRVVVIGGNVDHVHSYTSPSRKCSCDLRRKPAPRSPE